MGNWKKNQGRWVQISFGARDSIRLTGTAVLATEGGQLKERELRISRKAPPWFEKLCRSRAGTNFQIRVKVVGLFKNTLAYVSPCAETAEEALAEWAAIHPEIQQNEIEKQEKRKVLAEQAHAVYAQRKQMAITAHLHTALRSYALARDKEGRSIEISGGTIVGHHQDGLSRGEFDFGQLVDLYVRHTLISTEQPKFKITSIS